MARTWFGSPSDTTLMNRLGRHADQLPKRERLLYRARDTSTTVTSFARQLADINQRFPDFAAAIQAYGELMVHQGGRAGYGSREAIVSFERLAALMPSDVAIVSHWLGACTLAGDLECATRSRIAFDHIFDKMFASDTTPRDEFRAGERVIGSLFAPTTVRGLKNRAFVVKVNRLLRF